MIFLFQSVTPFPRTTPGWQNEFPGSHSFHMIDPAVQNQNIHHRLAIFELSKIKSIGFGRNSPSLRVKPSVTCSEVS